MPLDGPFTLFYFASRGAAELLYHPAAQELGAHSKPGGEPMVMMESLLNEARAANDRLGRSIDELIAELAAARAWARTAGTPYSTTPSGVSAHEQSLRPGTASRGPL